MIALDIAENTGVCIFNKSLLKVIEIKEHNPVEQFKKLNKLIGKEKDILIEKFVYFGSGNSSNTISSLLERIGYIRYKLLELDKNVEFIYPQSYQSWFINTYDLTNTLKTTKYKKSKKKLVIRDFLKNYYKIDLTDNHTDAIAMVLFKNNLERLPKCKIILS